MSQAGNEGNVGELVSAVEESVSSGEMDVKAKPPQTTSDGADWKRNMSNGAGELGSGIKGAAKETTGDVKDLTKKGHPGIPMLLAIIFGILAIAGFFVTPWPFALTLLVLCAGCAIWAGVAWHKSSATKAEATQTDDTTTRTPDVAQTRALTHNPSAMPSREDVVQAEPRDTMQSGTI
jgi:hypothetical protein